MDNKAYLQSIASPIPKPTKQPFNFKKIKIIKIAIVVVFLLVSLLIFQNTLTSLRKKPQDAVFKLNLTTVKLSATLDSYSPKLKSPNLRKINSSLKTSLTQIGNLSGEYVASLGKKYLPSKSIQSSVDTNISTLTSNLEDARINDQLDRSYLQNIIYQTSSLSAIISEVLSYNSLPKAFTTSIKDLQQSLNANHSDLVEFKDPSL